MYKYGVLIFQMNSSYISPQISINTFHGYDPFPGHTRPQIKRKYPPRFQKPPIKHISKAFPLKGTIWQKHKRCVSLSCVMKQCPSRPSSVWQYARACVLLRPHAVHFEGKWRDVLHVSSQCFSRKTADWSCSRNRYQLYCQIPPGWTEISVHVPRAGVEQGLTKDDIGFVSFRRWRSGGFHYVAVTQH